MIKYIIPNIIHDCIEDINAYLKSDVPLECYQDDIDQKLSDMKQQVIEAFDKKCYVVELMINSGGYEKHIPHVITNVDTEEEAIEYAVRNESHDREDDTPPDENGYYEDCNCEFMYRPTSVREVTREQADLLKKYI